MFGDLILKIKEKWKQFWCIHDYKQHYVHQVGRSYDECSKCGRIR
jgi:hypothetical protein